MKLLNSVSCHSWPKNSCYSPPNGSEINVSIFLTLTRKFSINLRVTTSSWRHIKLVLNTPAYKQNEARQMNKRRDYTFLRSNWPFRHDWVGRECNVNSYFLFYLSQKISRVILYVPVEAYMLPYFSVRRQTFESWKTRLF